MATKWFVSLFEPQGLEDETLRLQLCHGTEHPSREVAGRMLVNVLRAAQDGGFGIREFEQAPPGGRAWVLRLGDEEKVLAIYPEVPRA